MTTSYSCDSCGSEVVPGGANVLALLQQIEGLERMNRDLRRWLAVYISAGPPGSMNQIQALRLELAAQNAALVKAHRALALYAMPNPARPDRHLTAATAMESVLNPELLLEEHDAEIWKAAEQKAIEAVGQQPEPPADMSDDMTEFLQTFGVGHFLRSAVSVAKKDIQTRIRKEFSLACNKQDIGQ